MFRGQKTRFGDIEIENKVESLFFWGGEFVPKKTPAIEFWDYDPVTFEKWWTAAGFFGCDFVEWPVKDLYRRLAHALPADQPVRLKLFRQYLSHIGIHYYINDAGEQVVGVSHVHCPKEGHPMIAIVPVLKRITYNPGQILIYKEPNELRFPLVPEFVVPTPELRMPYEKTQLTYIAPHTYSGTIEEVRKWLELFGAYPEPRVAWPTADLHRRFRYGCRSKIGFDSFESMLEHCGYKVDACYARIFISPSPVDLDAELLAAEMTLHPSRAPGRPNKLGPTRLVSTVYPTPLLDRLKVVVENTGETQSDILRLALDMFLQGLERP